MMVSYTSFSFFLLYFGITFVVYSLLPQKIRWCVLLAGSYSFYFISAKGHIFPICLAALVSWAVGLWLQALSSVMEKKKRDAQKEEKKQIKNRYQGYRQTVLAIGILSVLSMLLIIKYGNFFIGNINAVFPARLPELELAQPLGLSFFILESISYMADVYYGKTEAEKNPLKVSLYFSFLLTVVEGPVSRYGQLGIQLAQGGQSRLEDISKGFLRVLWGLFKKVVIADRAVILANYVFDNHEYHSGIIVAAGIAFYTLQLYCEFSGIMDVVCGLGSMFGLRLPENFERPFFARTVNEFWKRWHITLGEWLRDYVFYSVSFSKLFKNIAINTKSRFNPYYANMIPTAIALFAVWFTNGFWHGAGWKYIVYGLYYYSVMMVGLFLEPAFNKICEMVNIDRASKTYKTFQLIRTLLIVNIGMLIFRAESLKTAASMFLSLFRWTDFADLLQPRGLGLNVSGPDIALIIIGFFVILLVSVLEERKIDLKEKIYQLPYLTKSSIYITILFVIIIFGAYGEEYGVVDLIYANF